MRTRSAVVHRSHSIDLTGSMITTAPSDEHRVVRYRFIARFDLVNFFDRICTLARLLATATNNLGQLVDFVARIEHR
jgi:hypothetical protein